MRPTRASSNFVQRVPMKSDGETSPPKSKPPSAETSWYLALVSRRKNEPGLAVDDDSTSDQARGLAQQLVCASVHQKSADQTLCHRTVRTNTLGASLWLLQKITVLSREPAASGHRRRQTLRTSLGYDSKFSTSSRSRMLRLVRWTVAICFLGWMRNAKWWNRAQVSNKIIPVTC